MLNFLYDQFQGKIIKYFSGVNLIAKFNCVFSVHALIAFVLTT